MINIHLLALVLQSGSTEYRLRLTDAHPILILRLITITGLAHLRFIPFLLLRSLFLTPHVFKILQFLLVILNKLHAVLVSLSHFLNFQRVRLNVVQNYGLNSGVVLLHQVLVF